MPLYMQISKDEKEDMAKDEAIARLCITSYLAKMTGRDFSRVYIPQKIDFSSSHHLLLADGGGIANSW